MSEINFIMSCSVSTVPDMFPKYGKRFSVYTVNEDDTIITGFADMQNNTYVLFIVQDVGPGLSVQTEEFIYKPFVKIDNLSEGLGLGLPLTKRHALFLGGDLIYDETYHEGCRFIIEMPK